MKPKVAMTAIVNSVVVSATLSVSFKQSLPRTLWHNCGTAALCHDHMQSIESGHPHIADDESRLPLGTPRMRDVLRELDSRLDFIDNEALMLQPLTKPPHLEVVICHENPAWPGEGWRGEL